MTTDPYLQAEFDALAIWRINTTDHTKDEAEAAIDLALDLATTAVNLDEVDVAYRIRVKIQSIRSSFARAARPIEIDHDETGHREHQLSRAGLTF